MRRARVEARERANRARIRARSQASRSLDALQRSRYLTCAALRNLIGFERNHGGSANAERNRRLVTHLWSLRYSLTSARLVGENMLETFMARIKQVDRRKAFWTLLTAKLLGVAALVLLIKGIAFYFATPALADEAAAAPPAYVNPLNTLWVLVAAFLVFFMQAGFMALEAGFARTRETVNILLEGIVDTCLCGILFWAWGFAFMFGAGNGFIGHQYFFLHGAPDTYGSTGVAFLAFFLFQFAFADTCSTITSGAMVGRTGFV